MSILHIYTSYIWNKLIQIRLCLICTSVSMYISIKTYITDIFALYYRYSLFTVSVLQLKNDFKTPMQHFVRKPSRLWSFAFYNFAHSHLWAWSMFQYCWLMMFQFHPIQFLLHQSNLSNVCWSIFLTNGDQ